jgi:hypothetical protein
MILTTVDTMKQKTDQCRERAIRCFKQNHVQNGYHGNSHQDQQLKPTKQKTNPRIPIPSHIPHEPPIHHPTNLKLLPQQLLNHSLQPLHLLIRLTNILIRSITRTRLTAQRSSIPPRFGNCHVALRLRERGICVLKLEHFEPVALLVVRGEMSRDGVGGFGGGC